MIRKARSDEFSAVMRIVESALLEIDPGDVDGAIERDAVLVAVSEGHVRGALVLDDGRMEAIAVNRTHRAKGIGSALVRAAAERGPLVAEFRPEIRPFYESLGFEIECDERCRGRLAGRES